MAEIQDELPQRDDRSQSGRFLFENNGVGYCDDGIDGLVHDVPFDKGPWVKSDTDAARSLLVLNFDLADSRRVHEQVTPLLLDTGIATVDLWRRFQLPRDFGSFPTGALSIWAKNADVSATDSAVLRIYNASTNANIISSFIPAVDGTWEEFVANMPEGLAPYLAGQWFTLNVQFTVSDLANVWSFGDLSLLYKSARGNI